ncbi:hypothetical protein PaG_03171 [Moesziomyces aphidis]|uniref:Translationally-controlled tumor protein homolog n=1 Tax=Moesziomyces aphidis TaxID=84754 RepID=W3VLU9_MOEAP|nr:hypothetical protein PaG_03171 [Moesziomyces aphidis]
MKVRTFLTPHLRLDTKIICSTQQSAHRGSIAGLANPPELVAFVGRQRTTTIDFCLAVYNGFYAAMDCARKVALYTDVIANDEMCSDGYEMKLVDDVVYEVDAAKIVVSDGDVDIGGNPSAEEEAEALENGAEQVINIVHSFRLQSTSFDKKSYLAYLKGYMKSVKAKLAETNPDRIPAFEKGAAAFAKKIVGSFGDWEFFTGESMDPEGMVALLNYREDGVTPYLVFWKDGLRETKI